MELTKQRLGVIIFSIIAAAALLIYFILYSPLIKKLKIQRLECNRLEAEAQAARNNTASLKMDDIKRTFISENDISLAIDELTREGKLRGINFVSLTPKPIEPPTSSQPYKILPIEIELESTYEALGLFLGSLEKLEKSLITIRNFGIISNKENPLKLKTKAIVAMGIAAD